MTLTKAELADSLYEHLNYSKADAKNIVDDYFEVIRGKLEAGEEVKLSGFGNFELRKKRARPGRNPKTGEMVAVAAKNAPKFKPGKALKDAVN